MEANEWRYSDELTVFEDENIDPHFEIVDHDVESLTSEENVSVDDFEEEQVNVVINSSDFEESDLSFRYKLASWAVLPGVKNVHVKKLLALLRTHPCHSDLPADVRSLIGTPRIVVVHEVHPGHYFHLGIVKGLNIVLNDVIRSNKSLELIDIFVNMDGLPISSSTGGQFWVILGAVRGFHGLEKKVFVIGIYYSQEKPSGPNTFLKEFVSEMKTVMATGFTHFDKLIKIRNCSFICDEPARAFIPGTRYHSGRSACSKCTTVGESAC